jgi:Cu/Ag efflux protein CusF
VARPRPKPAATKVGHQAEGKVEEVDTKAGTVSVTHGPVASLKWPGMTMEFKAANEAILKQLKPGAAIDFEFVERGQGEWVITSVKLASQPAGKANPHAGH